MTAGPDVVLLVGASSGIGRATAHRLAARGARLVLVARGRGPLEATAAECRDKGAASVTVMCADIGDAEQVEQVVRQTEAAYGRIDVAIQSAGVVAYGTFLDVPREIFDGVLRVNLLGSANVARSVLPGMRDRRRGTLVLLGSVLGEINVPLMSPYVVSKWALHALVRELQIENRDHPNVHITRVTPGPVDTPIYLQAANYAGRVGRPPPPVISPERAARAVVAAVDSPDRRKVNVGLGNPVMRAGFTVLPRVFDTIVGPLFAVAGLDQRPTPPGPGNVIEPREELNRLYGDQGSSVLAAAKAVGARAAALVRRS